MNRPCFLVIDREYAASISTRKLVIETAKLNVITAYSSAEAIEVLRRFPAVDAIVTNAKPEGMPFRALCDALRAIRSNVVIIAISNMGRHDATGADHVLDTFEPARLLTLLHALTPAANAEIEANEAKLDAKE